MKKKNVPVHFQIWKEMLKEDKNIKIKTHKGKYSTDKKCRSQLTVTLKIMLRIKKI